MSAYAAAFAVFQIYLDGYGFADNSIRAIKPTKKTSWFVLPIWEALFLGYHWI